MTFDRIYRIDRIRFVWEILWILSKKIIMQEIIPTYNVTVTQKRIIKYNTKSMWDKLETKLIMDSENMDSGKMGFVFVH